LQNTNIINESALFEKVSAIIENRKYRAQIAANSEVTIMFWEVGKYINSVILGSERAKYGKRIVATLSQQLSWSHFITLLPLKTDEAFMYYANAVNRFPAENKNINSEINLYNLCTQNPAETFLKCRVFYVEIC